MDGPDDLAVALVWDAIAALAGPTSMERGVAYVGEGRVGPITRSADAIEAVVEGGEPYRVRVALEGGTITGDCSCPMGEMGVFCKHCVALSVAWSMPQLDGIGRDRREREGVAAAASDDAIAMYLDGLDRDGLIALISDEAARDDGLAERLLLRALVASASSGAVADLRRALDRATAVPAFLPYGEVYAFAQGVHDVAHAVEGLIGQGRAEQAIDLSDRALRRLESGISQSDDSDGYLGDLLGRFEAIHLAACEVARPDPALLARRLFRWQIDSEVDVFHDAPERYAQILGETGLHEYRRLVEERWPHESARGSAASGDEDDPDDEDAVADDDDEDRDYRRRSILESLARASGDVDELIAVMASDLSHEYDYIRIVEVCRQAGRDDEALAWAERGLLAFPRRTDVRLRELLADEYLRRSRADDAMALMWAGLVDEPGLAAYRRLKDHADRIRAWDAWRPRAIEEVRRAVESAIASPPAEPSRWVRFRPPDGTALVEVLTWEGQVDEAWSEARRLRCQDHVMLQLAMQSEESRPDDALAVYRDEVTRTLRTADRRAYGEAISLLRRIRDVMAGLGRDEEFRAYAAEVRAANARRPTFRALFDAARLLVPVADGR